MPAKQRMIIVKNKGNTGGSGSLASSDQSHV
jgi:hypothetical protein